MQLTARSGVSGSNLSPFFAGGGIAVLAMIVGLLWRSLSSRGHAYAGR
jgi:hypothetical protein